MISDFLLFGPMMVRKMSYDTEVAIVTEIITHQLEYIMRFPTNITPSYKTLTFYPPNKTPSFHIHKHTIQTFSRFHLLFS